MTGDMPKGRAGAKAFLRSAGDFSWPPRWDRERAALIYDQTARRLVLDLKRDGRRDELETLCGWMRQAGGALINDAELLVPLHYTRLVVRGVNLSGWLAQAIGAETGREVRVDGLVRSRRTHSQAGLAGRARRRNVSGAFRVRKRGLAAIAGKLVLLVDDVLTTGATLSACTWP